MRHLKMMGLAAIAVFALVAFAGATTASATRLCSVATTPCPAANIYPVNTSFPADLLAGTNAVLTTSGSPVGVNPTLTCSASGVGVTNSNTGGGAGTPVNGHLGSLSFSSCTSVNPAGCSTSATVGSLAAATGTIAWTSGANGTLRLTPPTVSFTCPILGAPVTCVFGGSGTVDGTLTGGATPVVDIVNQAIASTGGFGCPTASQWNARYSVTKALFVSNS
jgi:hypothetical protein